jgi:hypothetical protein
MKENKIIVHKNILNINNVIREFPTNILQVIEFKNFIIIRIEYNSQISDNIIEVFLFIGVCYRIDVVERKVLKKEIVK